MKKQTKKQQSGRSMIEMVGVLAVMGLITAAAFVLINSAMSSQRLSRVDDDVSGIVQGVRLLYNSQPDFNGVGEDTLYLLGFGTPAKGNVAAKPYQNPYGGSYVLTADNENRAFKITLTGLGAKTCGVLADRDWNGGGSNPTCDTDGTLKKLTITYGKADTKVNP